MKTEKERRYTIALHTRLQNDGDDGIRVYDEYLQREYLEKYPNCYTVLESGVLGKDVNDIVRQWEQSLNKFSQIPQPENIQRGFKMFEHCQTGKLVWDCDASAGANQSQALVEIANQLRRLNDNLEKRNGDNNGI